MSVEPTKLKKLKGNPGRRPLPANEPEPEVADTLPSPPAHMSASAKAEWKNMAAKLYRLGLLTEVDTSALALYCQAYGRWVDAEKKLKITGMVISTTNGNIIQSPYVGIANKAMAACHNYLKEFGMTPSSRTKVTATAPKQKSKFEGLVALPGGKK